MMEFKTFCLLYTYITHVLPDFVVRIKCDDITTWLIYTKTVQSDYWTNDSYNLFLLSELETYSANIVPIHAQITLLNHSF